eukprot:jgi/Chlat1/6955/Chrsp52S06628
MVALMDIYGENENEDADKEYAVVNKLEQALGLEQGVRGMEHSSGRFVSAAQVAEQRRRLESSSFGSSTDNDRAIAALLQEEMGTDSHGAGPSGRVGSQSDAELASVLQQEEDHAHTAGSQPAMPSQSMQGRDLAMTASLAGIQTQQHTPHVNLTFPTATQADIAAQRLTERLYRFGLRQLHIIGDGNCQFRAVADQLYRNQELHPHVRAAATKQLREHPELYSMYVPDSYFYYVVCMQRHGTWGDALTLQAIADAYGMTVCVLTSYQQATTIEVTPRRSRSQRTLWLSFWAEVHYNSLYPAADLPLVADYQSAYGQRALQPKLNNNRGWLKALFGRSSRSPVISA